MSVLENSAREQAPRYQGAGWLQRNLAGGKEARTLSPLGRTVADILGQVFRGIYHLSSSSLFHQRTDWSSNHTIAVTIPNELANHDDDSLTQIVLLAHAAGLRLAITGAARRYLELRFSSRAGTMFFGAVPTVAEVFERFRSAYPDGLAPWKDLEGDR